MSFQIPNTTTTTTGFSLTSTPSVAAPKPPSFSFGTNIGGGDADSAKPLGFGLNTASNASVATTTSTGLGTGFFSVPAATAAAAATTGTPVPAAAPVAAATPPTLAAAPTFNFGATPQTATTAPIATTTAAAPSFGFGTPAATVTTSAPTFSFGTNLVATSGVGTGLNLTKTTASLNPGLTSSTTTPAGGFASLSTATKTTDSNAITTASQISYNQLEEHINKWTLELEEQEKIFTEQATQINAWDKILINNNQKILELNDAVQKVKADQQTLEQELEFIATQHKELEESILPLQKEFQTIPQVDVERSQTYLLVENLDTQLKQMSEDLKEIIDNLNESNKSQNVNDPIVQIGKILNAHMTSLQWIETQTSNMAEKLGGIEKLHESYKRDTERSFRAAYLM